MHLHAKRKRDEAEAVEDAEAVRIMGRLNELNLGTLKGYYTCIGIRILVCTY